MILSEPGRAAVLGQEAKETIMVAAKESKVIGDIRGKGLMIGVELVKNKETREPANADAVGRVAKKLEQRGVRVMPSGRHRNTVRLMPTSGNTMITASSTSSALARRENITRRLECSDSARINRASIVPLSHIAASKVTATQKSPCSSSHRVSFCVPI